MFKKRPSGKVSKLQWREPLLVHPSVTQEEVEKVRARCDQGELVLDYYLVTLSDTPGNRLEIFPCALLRQKDFFSQVPFIVGLAKGKRGGMELAAAIELELDCFIPR